MNDFLQKTGSFLTGVNYWASHAATEMWSKWDAAAVEADFSALRDCGVTVLRCFPLWPDFQPIKLLRLAGPPGGAPYEIRMGEAPLPDTPAGRAGVSETMMEHFTEFCDLAQKYHMQLIVCPLTGQMTSRLFVPPALEGLDAFTHPLALKWEVKFIKYFVSRMKLHPAIAAWESGNESIFLSQASEAAAAWSWTTLIHDAIRCCDNTRPIIGVSCLLPEETQNCKWVIADQAELSDILSSHAYSLWNDAYGREEFNTVRNLHHASGECRIVRDLGGKPCFTEETGTWRPMAGSYDTTAAALRNILWNNYQEDCRGVVWWCAFDQDNIHVAPYDWTTMGLEHGIMTSERKLRPTALALRDFRRFLDALPFDRLPPHGVDAVCIVNNMDIAYAAYILARQAGINLKFQHPSAPWVDAEVYFVPTATRRAGFSTGKWHELLERVRAGATLYLALDDTILDGLEAVTGCGVVSRKWTQDVGQYDFGDFRVALPRTNRYLMTAYGAEVLATEADGNPVFFRHRYGQGTVYTLAFPLERNVIDTTDAFQTDAWKIFREVWQPPRVVRSTNQFLMITEHYFDDTHLAVVLVNNQPRPWEEKLLLDDRWTVTAVFSDHPEAVFARQTITLPANAGMLLNLNSSSNRGERR